MKMNVCLQIFLVCFVFMFTSVEAGVNLDSITYKSFAHQQFAAWPKIIELETKNLTPDNASIEDVEHLFINYYGYIGHLLDTKREKEAEVWLGKAQADFKPYFDKYSNEASINALYSMFLAYDMALSPVTAPFKLLRLNSIIKKAKELDKENYLVKISQANIAFYFPEALGGDKEEALNYYLQVYIYFKQHPAIAKYDWVYLNTLSTICLVHEKLGRYKEAIDWAKLALTVAPDFVIVKDMIMPRLREYKN